MSNNDRKPDVPSSPSSDMVTMSKAEHQSMLTAAVTAALAAAGLSGQSVPAALTQEQETAEKFKREHPPGNAVTYVPFISREPFGTGARMLLVVSHKGNVVGIHRYMLPTGWDQPMALHAEPGPLGRLPHGTRTTKANGTPDPRMMMMIYHQYYVKDNHTVLRRPVFASGRMTEAEVAEALAIDPDFMTPEGTSAIGSVYREPDAA